MQPATFSGRNMVLNGALVAMLCAFWSVAVLAVELPSADLPPESDPPDCGALISHYWGLGSSYSGPGTQFDFDGMSMRCFGGPVQRTPIGVDEQQIFSANLATTVTIDLGGGPIGPFSAMLTGPVETLVTDRALSTTGVFNAEIVSMALSGDAGGMPILLRENPGAASVGQIDISDIGGGLFSIESFFDVVTEISVDGGATWIAAGDSQRLTLMPRDEVPVELQSFAVE